MAKIDPQQPFGATDSERQLLNEIRSFAAGVVKRYFFAFSTTKLLHRIPGLVQRYP